MRKTAVILIVVLAAVAAVILRSAPGIAQPAATQPGVLTGAHLEIRPVKGPGPRMDLRPQFADADATAARIGAMVPVGKTDLAVKSTSAVPVTFDGHVSKFEYGDATHVTFPNNHGTVDVFIKVSDGYLYFAYQIPDLSPFMGDDIVTMLDLKDEKAAAPTKDTIRAYVRRKMENSRTQEGDGTKWVDNYGPWEYRSALYPNGWEVETRIPLKAINVEMNPGPGKKTTLGVAFRIWDNEPEKMSNWPAGSNEKKPETWGTLIIE